MHRHVYRQHADEGQQEYFGSTDAVRGGQPQTPPDDELDHQQGPENAIARQRHGAQSNACFGRK